MTNVAESLSILLADDDPIFCSLAHSCLEEAGHQVRIVGDGALAIEHLNAQTCDVAVIDLTMPRVDGFRLISLIRHTSRIMKMPIMVVSSRADDVSLIEARRLGADAYKTKPVDWATFASDVSRLVQEIRTRSPVRKA